MVVKLESTRNNQGHKNVCLKLAVRSPHCSRIFGGSVDLMNAHNHGERGQRTSCFHGQTTRSYGFQCTVSTMCIMHGEHADIFFFLRRGAGAWGWSCPSLQGRFRVWIWDSLGWHGDYVCMIEGTPESLKGILATMQYYNG